MREIKIKQRVFSGIQPSGKLTFGSYAGAIKSWRDMQNEYDCLFCIVDLHAITVRQNARELRNRCLEQLAQYIACGINPNKSVIFIQSQIPYHAHLAWILGCYTQFGELSRMHQYKTKSEQHSENVNAGLFTYPVLMAADILLYQSDLVPVGDDQKQHIEVCRDIAQRFNSIYGDVFKLPVSYTPKIGARIMSLNNPLSKMSKSIPEGCLYLMDSNDIIAKKIKRSITDGGLEVRYDPVEKPGISNLMDMYAVVTSLTYQEIEDKFNGMGYGKFKAEVSDALIGVIEPIRERALELLTDKGYLQGLYSRGAEKAIKMSYETISKVHKAVGLYPIDLGG